MIVLVAQWDTTSASDFATLAYQTALHTPQATHQQYAPLVLLDLLLLAALAPHVLLIVLLALLEQVNAMLLYVPLDTRPVALLAP